MSGTPPLGVNLTDECERRYGKAVASPAAPKEGDPTVEHVIDYRDALHEANARIAARNQCEAEQRARYGGKND
jgi:hypothetical protein